MKKLAYCAAALTLTVSSAIAADLPSRKAPAPYVPPPPVFSWTGVYVGVNLGGGWLDRYNVQGYGTAWNGIGWWPVYVPYGDSSPGGIVGGGQIGYNYQISPLFVVGVEADIQGASIGGGTQWWGGVAKRGIDWFGTVRGRVGVSLFNPQLLVYGTGGFAYGDLRLNLPLYSGFRQTATGWTVGGGVEYAFLQDWSAKVEYLYTNIGASYPGAPSVQHRAHLHTVRAGLNWHLNLFSSPAPVLAKY